jgi:hypothetical protein
MLEFLKLPPGCRNEMLQPSVEPTTKRLGSSVANYALLLRFSISGFLAISGVS